MTNSSGVVLLMVLILSAIMYLIASTLLLITMTEIHISDFEQRSTQAFYAAESGVTLGLSKLRENPDYRHKNDLYDTSIGGNPGYFIVQTYDGSDDGYGYYRSSLNPSLYHLVVRGVGVVSGLNASAKRTVERDVVVKPFALFAWDTLYLTNGATIIGNVHANNLLVIDSGSAVTGDVTSNSPVINNGTVTGTVSSLEPEIAFLPSPIAFYFPRYWYNGKEYEAKPLAHDTVTLSPVGGVDPPAPSIEVYSGFPTPDNPAGVFYPDSEITGTLVALQVNGTVIIPQPQQLFLNGAITITPVDNFPALISAKNLDITLIGNLETFSGSLEKSQIQGLIYVWGNISIIGNNIPGEIIKGSILGLTVRITGNPVFQVTYDPTILSNPPPGIDFIELDEWRELFEQTN
jgi:hypothetical protein